MCRLMAWVSTEPMTIAEMFGDGAVSRLQLLSTVHCDGWGTAYVDEQGARGVIRRAHPAHEDDDFVDFTQHVRTRAGLLHLRLATPGYGQGLRNVHPFTHGEWSFAHNGAIGPRDRLSALEPDPATWTDESDTDSERFMGVIRQSMAAGASVAAGVDAALARMRTGGLVANSLNSILLGPRDLHVISWHDPAATTGSVQVWPSELMADGTPWPPYLPLQGSRQPQLFRAASSGVVDVDRHDAEWTPMANHAVESYRLDRPGSAVIEPIATVSVPRPDASYARTADDLDA